MSREDQRPYPHRRACPRMPLLSEDNPLDLEPLSCCRRDYEQSEAAQRLARLLDMDEEDEI